MNIVNTSKQFEQTSAKQIASASTSSAVSPSSLSSSLSSSASSSSISLSNGNTCSKFAPVNTSSSASSAKSIEHVYYAKLVQFDRSKKEQQQQQTESMSNRDDLLTGKSTSIANDYDDDEYDYYNTIIKKDFDDIDLRSINRFKNNTNVSNPTNKAFSSLPVANTKQNKLVDQEDMDDVDEDENKERYLNKDCFKSSNITKTDNKENNKVVFIKKFNSLSESSTESSESSSLSSKKSITPNTTTTHNNNNNNTNNNKFKKFTSNINNYENDTTCSINNNGLISAANSTIIRRLSSNQNSSSTNNNLNINNSNEKAFVKLINTEVAKTLNANNEAMKMSSWLPKTIVANNNNTNVNQSSASNEILKTSKTIINHYNNSQNTMNSNHVPFQSSALLLKKSPNSEVQTNSSQTSKCFQYSLITTQISKANNNMTTTTTKPTNIIIKSSNAITGASSLQPVVNSSTTSSSASSPLSSSSACSFQASTSSSSTSSSSSLTLEQNTRRSVDPKYNLNNYLANATSANNTKANSLSKNDLLTLKPPMSSSSSSSSSASSSVKLTDIKAKQSIFDSTLLTPLTPISHSLKQKQFSNANINSNTNSLKKSNVISIENISPPTLVSFDTFLNKESSKRLQPPIQVNQQASNVKSASTSYLLSKITSIASLTMPKTRLSTANTPSTNSSSNCSYISTNSASTNQSSTSSNNSPASSKTSSKTSSNTGHTINLRAVKSMASVDNVSRDSLSSSHVTSRRTFSKKRSQSQCQSNINSVIWYYNKNDDFWSTAADGLNSGQMIRLNKIAIRYLTLIELKYLKQICFNKFQAFLNSLQQQEKQKQKQKLKIKSSLSQLSTTASQTNTNAVNSTSALPYQSSSSASTFIKLTIPKDDSMKFVKTKNITSAHRSKSVDFKFFDDLKDSYLFNNSNSGGNGGSGGHFSSSSSSNNRQNLVFGQSLYKCILNDLQLTSSNQKLKTSTSSILSKSKFRSLNKDNLLIASKFDMNILNTIVNNVNANNSEIVNTTNENTSDLFSKRNSVLFEALDLKDVNKSMSNLLEQQQKQDNGECNLPSISKTNSKKKMSVDSSLSFLLNKNNQTTQSTQNEVLNSQNLSIRSEGLVPNIVKSCCKHINQYGLDVVGIFRIDSSKKRIKEIKAMFDSTGGKDIVLDESYNANDVACILKEYLRSLPEPLLTRELYSCFLATEKIRCPNERLECIRHLICLLPVPNRDTLQVLLKLLDNVRMHANVIDPEKSPSGSCGGNKMDAFNLAMVFGPNLLKKYKNSTTSTSTLRTSIDYSFGHHSSNGNHSSNSSKYNLIDDIDTVISVTKYLIENQNSIFEIESNMHNELFETIGSVCSHEEINAIMTRKIIASIGITMLTDDQNSELKESNEPPANFLDNTDCGYLEENKQNKLTKCRVSRTRLHKITNNLNFNNIVMGNSVNMVVNEIQPQLAEPISFLTSPSNSPRARRKTFGAPSNKHLLKKSSLLSNNSFKHFNNELYSNLVNENEINQNQAEPKIQLSSNTNTNGTLSSSSLLLMIQSNTNNFKNLNVNKQNGVIEKPSGLNQSHSMKLNAKSTKSLSNMGSSDLISENGQRNINSQSVDMSSASHLKLINSNTIQICSKFYEKSKFNVIGEQETLV